MIRRRKFGWALRCANGDDEARAPWSALLAVVLFYVAAGIVGEATQRQSTFTWTVARVLWFLLAVSVIATWVGGWWGAIWSITGYVVGVILGELIGNPVLEAQRARLAEQKLDPDYIQNWEPTHPGWWISLLTFIAFSIVGPLLQRRRKRRVAQQ